MKYLLPLLALLALLAWRHERNETESLLDVYYRRMTP